jgi:hypothetical protein
MQVRVDGIGFVEVEQHGVGFEHRVEFGLLEQPNGGAQGAHVVLASHRVRLRRKTRREREAVGGESELPVRAHLDSLGTWTPPNKTAALPESFSAT